MNQEHFRVAPQLSHSLMGRALHAVHLTDVCAMPAGPPVVGLVSHLSNSPIAPGSSPLHLTPGVPDADELFLLSPVVHLPTTRHRRLSPCHCPGYFIAIKVSHS